MELLRQAGLVLRKDLLFLASEDFRRRVVLLRHRPGAGLVAIGGFQECRHFRRESSWACWGNLHDLPSNLD